MFILQRFFNYSTSKLDELIDNNNPIEDILNESTILQDIQSQHLSQKLLLYIRDDPDKLTQLLGFILNPPNPNDQSDRAYRFPFIASEILSRECDPLLELFCEQPEYFDKLFSFIKQDSLDPTQAAYFTKVVLLLLRRRYSRTLQYLNDRLIGHLLKHLDSPHIAEIVEKLLMPEHLEPQFMPSLQKLVKRVMNIALHKPYDQETLDNALNILNNLLKVTQYEQGVSTLLDPLFSPRFFLTVNFQSPRPAAYELIINLLNFIKHNDKQDYSQFKEVAVYFPKALDSTDILASEFESTYGEVVRPLSGKGQLFQIFYLLLDSGNEELISTLSGNGSFKALTELVIRQQFNNQIQIWYEKIVVLVLSKSFPQMQHVVLSVLQETLREYNVDQKVQVGKLKNKIKPGFQGVLTVIANHLLQRNLELDPTFKAYADSIISRINQLERSLLCNVDPKPHSRMGLQDSTLLYQGDQLYSNMLVQTPQPANEENDAGEDCEDEFQDCADVQDAEQAQGHQFEQGQETDHHHQGERKHSGESEEQRRQLEDESEQIQNYIASPETKAQDMAVLIEKEQEMKLDSQTDPIELENTLDHQVVEFSKTHQDLK